MSIINTSMAAFFAAATTILTNAQNQPQIAAALKNFGYDEAKLRDGQNLLTAARTLYDAQIKEYGEQHAATQTFEIACQQADKTYTNHRNIAKIAFKTDPQRQTDLHLNRRKPKAYAPWYEQARHFYTAALADAEIQKQFTKYNLTLTTLQTAQTQVEQTNTLKTAQEKEKGEAQNATQQRDTAFADLEEWLADFKIIAHIALQDTPQLLESLDLGAIP